MPLTPAEFQESLIHEITETKALVLLYLQKTLDEQSFRDIQFKARDIAKNEVKRIFKPDSQTPAT